MRPLLFGTIGDNTIDQYVGDDGRSFVGGNAINVAVQLRAPGHSVRYAGAVGPDEDGRRVRAALEARQIDVTGLVVLPGVTSISRIRVEPSGERIIEFEDFAVCADYRPSDADLDALAGCDFVHLGMTPFAGVIRAGLASRGVRASQDCAVSAGYDNLSVAFCSAGEDATVARALGEAAIEGGAELAIVTCGADGSLAFDGRSWWTQDAHTTQLVDATGAGDSYIAGFLASFARESDVKRAMDAGSAAAARTCRHWGGFPQGADCTPHSRVDP